VRYGVALGRAFEATLHLHAAVRHELQVMVERQRVIDLFLGQDAATTSPPNAAHALLATLLTADEQQAVRAEYVLRASGPGPYVEIVRYAKERDIDLIVMGTHGRGFVAHMLMGSVAEKVVRRSPCPVLTVRHQEHDFVVPS
jgi:nucleotide-binding universal stress UspA family protein